MTDEERAEAFACNGYALGCSKLPFDSAKEGYLAGLKAGRPKWHKVADGDYPPCKRGNYTITVLTDFGNIAYYDYDLDCWIAKSSSTEIDPPIAWCEIPEYKKE